MLVLVQESNRKDLNAWLGGVCIDYMLRERSARMNHCSENLSLREVRVVEEQTTKMSAMVKIGKLVP